LAKDLNINFFQKYLQIVNKHMKKCSTSLATREIKTKITMTYHFIQTRMVITQKRDGNKLGRGCGRIRALFMYPWEMKVYICSETHGNFYISIVQNNWKVENSRCSPSTNGYIDVAYPYNGMLCPSEMNGDSCMLHLSEPWKHHVKWEKSVIKDFIYRIPFLWNFHNRKIHTDQMLISSCQELGKGEMLSGCMAFFFVFGVMKMFKIRW
jgi:hypothetical protein